MSTRNPVPRPGSTRLEPSSDKRELPLLKWSRGRRCLAAQSDTSVPSGDQYWSDSATTGLAGPLPRAGRILASGGGLSGRCGSQRSRPPPATSPARDAHGARASCSPSWSCGKSPLIHHFFGPPSTAPTASRSEHVPLLHRQMAPEMQEVSLPADGRCRKYYGISHFAASRG